MDLNRIALRIAGRIEQGEPESCLDAAPAAVDEEEGYVVASLLVLTTGVVPDGPAVACGPELAGGDVAADDACHGFGVVVDPEDVRAGHRGGGDGGRAAAAGDRR